MRASCLIMIILAHNLYRSASPSGENVAQERQCDLLSAAGIPVHSWTLASDVLASSSPINQFLTAWHLAGSQARRKTFVTKLATLKREGATVVHLHNPWPLFTYDIAVAAQEVGLPIVQTLHNYRMISTNNRLVEAGCLRPSRNDAELLHLQRSANNHSWLANPFYNRALDNLWKKRIPQTAVNSYVCLTSFQRRLLLAAGISAERAVVIPNFLDHQGPIGHEPGDYALFVGRLDHTKGIDRLMRWWPQHGPPLHIIGDGPLAGLVSGHPRIQSLGRLPFTEVQRKMAGARFLVMASTWYEGLPLVLIEALAAGTPCLVPDLGGMAEVIQDGITGVVFLPNDDVRAADAVQRLWDGAPTMRPACRRAYETQFTPQQHLKSLLMLYQSVKPPPKPIF